MSQIQKEIEPKLMNIEAYLKLAQKQGDFAIPPFQRAYSWEINQCDKLWQDVLDFIDNKRDERYFFGTIIINCAEDSKLELIDGQQRTTTFLLLLKALLLNINYVLNNIQSDDEYMEKTLRGLRQKRTTLMSIICTNPDSYCFSENPNDLKDHDFMKDIAFIDNKSINEPEENRVELNKILSAISYDEVKKNVRKIKYKKKENKYTNFFKNFDFFYKKLLSLCRNPSGDGAAVLLQFSKTLLGKCELIVIKSWMQEEAIAMFNSLNSDGLPLNDCDIIAAKLFAVAENKGCSDEFGQKWQELDQLITSMDTNILTMDSILMQQMYYTRTKKEETGTYEKPNITTPGLRRYYTEINKDLLSAPLELCDGLINLTMIWKKILKDYPLMSVLLKFNENSKFFLASYFFRFKEADISPNMPEIITILECFLRLFVILELVETGYSNANFKTFLFKEEIKLIDPEVDVSEISVHFAKHIQSNWKREDLEKAINAYNKNSLVILNEYLFAKEKGKVFKLEANYEIEHIMPQSGRNLDLIRQDAGLDSKEEFEDFVNKLGNKIILERKINESVGNDWFRSKINTTVRQKQGYKDSIYPIATSLVEKYKNDEKPYWRKEDIENATSKAADRILKFIFG